jgi:predicted homoserine dehydrogenase-like protein
MAVAKKDLRAGERLDDFGGFTFYGVIDRAEEAQRENALPVGLAPYARMKRDLPQDHLITWEDVTLEDNLLVRLRCEQDGRSTWTK